VRAFSLIELLVVVAIVALLAALILPGLARAREYAYFASCKSSLRQIGIGMLCYASDNRGRTPEGENRCTDKRPGSGGVVRAIGLQWRGGGLWPGAYSEMNSRSPTSTLLRKIYSEQLPTGTTPDSRSAWEPVEIHGGDGSGFVAGHLARPRMPGRYLPIDIMWDPITKVRDWGPWGSNGVLAPAVYNPSGPGPEFYYHYYAGTERQRDFLTRKIGVYGYTWFLFTVGCVDRNGNLNTTDHVMQSEGGTCRNPGYAETKRPNTRHRNPHSSNKPSVWLAACVTPIIHLSAAGGDNERQMKSHFGFRQMLPGWRHNAVHLDGHVHDQAWRIPVIPYYRQWAYVATHINGYHTNLPYGWLYVNPGGADNQNGSKYGIKLMDGFEGAFDEN
jgi:prepilin-type N-terminal cleavage/methylation domain-containing protein